MITMKGVKKYYGATQALDIAGLEIAKGDVAVFCGPSGSGKTTAIKTLNRLEPIQAGSIEIGGRPIGSYSTKELSTKVGFVSQKFDLFPNFSVLENVGVAKRVVLGRHAKEAARIALDYLDKVGMASFADKKPGQLSGGQQQRVAIARALAMTPEVVLFDEPTASLDPENVKSSLRLLEGLAKGGTTMVVVTHEMSFAKRVSNRIVFFEKGGVVLEDSPTEEFFKQPRTARAREFLDCLNLEA